MAGRPQRVTDRALAEAAIAAIGRVGPHGVTFAIVAEQCGISAAAVAQRFGTRRGMLLDAARRGADQLQHDLLSIDGSRQTSAEAVDQILHILVRDMADADTVANHTAFLLMDMRDDEFRTIAQRSLALIDHAVRRVLVASRARTLVVERSPVIVAAIHGTIIQWAIHRTGTLHDTLRTTIAPLLR